MTTLDSICEDIQRGIAVNLVIENIDDGKLNMLKGYLRNYVSDKVHGSISVSPAEGSMYHMTLHIPPIEQAKRTVVISALQRSNMSITRQQQHSTPETP